MSSSGANLSEIPIPLPDIPDSQRDEIQHAWLTNVRKNLERLRLTIAKLLCIIDYSKART